MPTPDQDRIAQDRAHPRVMQLWWALRPLVSVVRFMQTGAHPDDEISGMLAALAFRDGINISYACSTRGEGGQNDIGTEAGADLGALRTREMERACDVLGMRMYWHSTDPADSIVDFGFSKSGEETLARWGRDRTLQRFVEIVRTEKPDILCPTFLDVPGQHGHHRAMTQAAHEVMVAAADQDFPSNLAPWQVKKLYLPAWSGAGQAYDDDLPPPPATLAVVGMDREAMTGWNWNRIGQQSRAFHRTQGMGRWVPANAGHDWPLHLAVSHADGPDDAVWSGLPHNLADLAGVPGADAIAPELTAAQDQIDICLSAFPDFPRIADAAARAIAHVRAASGACPEDLSQDIQHRLASKEAQLGQVLRLALGIEARGRTQSVFIDAGTSSEFTCEVNASAARRLTATPDLPAGWSRDDTHLHIAADAVPTDPYRDHYDPLTPIAPRLNLAISHGGTDISVPVAFEVEPVVVPAERVSFHPSKALINTRSSDRTVKVAVADRSPKEGQLDLDAPDGWTVQRTQSGFDVIAPDDLAPGHYTLGGRVNGKPAKTVRLIHHDHAAPTLGAAAATISVGAFDVSVPNGRVGYIGGGNDRVAEWLSAIGADVTPLTDAELADDGALADFDAIVVGIFAMRFRHGLVAAVPALHRWCAAGGTLVTLYHRPWDNWDPDRVPPKRLEIGQPSLRWRVTDEAAHVTHIAEHPILSTPNPIGDADWAGWVKERGLYFAKSWDAAYTPLLSMADPGEEPLTGALLVADIGKGRHIHTSLILHHQMENLVPGAFRLMANFIAPRG